MNVLIEIGHPAHVHFFRQTIARLKSEGHGLVVVTRDKEITNQLLDRFDIEYLSLSLPATGKLGMASELLSRWSKIRSLIKSRSIDCVASISGISTSFPGKLTGVRNVLFTDNEDAHLSNRIAFPFADVIHTPEFYLEDLGNKHRRYFGLHELAYLQNFNFDRATEVRHSLGFPERYTIVRLVGNEALHDEGLKTLTDAQLESLEAGLTPWGEIRISSPLKLPPRWEARKLSIPIESVHDVLAGAQLFLGDSPTMAVESSLLGVPAFLFSNRIDALGNMVGLSETHQLLDCQKRLEETLASMKRVVNPGEFQQRWRERAERFRNATVPMNDYIYQAIVAPE